MTEAAWEVAEAPSADWPSESALLGAGFFHDPAYALWEDTRGGSKSLYLRFRAAGRTVAVGLGLESRPALWPFSARCARFMLGALPAVGGGEVQELRSAMQALHGALSARGVYAVEVRSLDSPQSEPVLAALGYELQPRAEFYIDLSLDKDELWRRLNTNRQRNLRKAGKLGVTTVAEEGREGLERLQAFQGESMSRHRVDFRPSLERTRAYGALVDSGSATLMTTYLEGRPVNAALFAVSGERAYYLTSGSSAAGFQCSGPAHAIWTMMDWAKARGLRCLNLGGAPSGSDASPDDKNLYLFKQSFGGTAVAQPSGVRVLDRVGQALHALGGAARRTLGMTRT